MDTDAAATTCPVVRAGQTAQRADGTPLAAGIFAETAGSRRLSLQTVVLPPELPGCKRETCPR